MCIVDNNTKEFLTSINLRNVKIYIIFSVISATCHWQFK